MWSDLVPPLPHVRIGRSTPTGLAPATGIPPKSPPMPGEMPAPWATAARFLNGPSGRTTPIGPRVRSEVPCPGPVPMIATSLSLLDCVDFPPPAAARALPPSGLWHWVCFVFISSEKTECFHSYIYAFLPGMTAPGGPVHSSIHPHGDGRPGLRPGGPTAKGRAGSLARPLPLAPSHTPRMGRLRPSLQQPARPHRAAWPVSRRPRTAPRSRSGTEGGDHGRPGPCRARGRPRSRHRSRFYTSILTRMS
jgi:hypothetical protein